MNAKHLLMMLAAYILCSACSNENLCQVVWTEGTTDDDGMATHTLEIQNPPAGTDWTLWFSQFRTPVAMEANAPGEIIFVGGTLYRAVPSAEAQGNVLTLRYKARALENQCRAPEGFYLQKRGQIPVAVECKYVYQPSQEVPSFAYNHVNTNVFDMIPRLKQVEATEGTTDLNQEAKTYIVSGQRAGWYKITLDGSVRIDAADKDGAYYASVTLDNLRRNAAGNAIPNAIITDWPDLTYRGLMLDVSRDFTKKADLLRLIDILAHYKINYFHLHFGDDEGWRIAIDALPELTTYGAARCIPTLNADGTINEPDALQPTYCIAADRNDTTSSGNGFYSHADFVDILRYAYERHIRVIPEFDTPGHSRAAIKSMEVRAARTGDTAYLLSEAGDTSVYMSVQDYSDNALNVALPSTYKFIETVFDGLINMYKEAGVPLDAIHIGGDEVPEGAWEGSPACLALLKASEHSDVTWLKDYYLNRVLDIAEARGVKLAGWQDICQHLEPATLARLKRSLFLTNLWTVSHGQDALPYEFANDGIPVVISSAPNCYLDFAYNDNKTERGHSWGGLVDERRTFSLQPYDMYRSVRFDDHRQPIDLTNAGEGKPALQANARESIIGVQGQLWAETIRNFNHVTYYIFPKGLGLFERGWNATPSWAGSIAPDDSAFMADFDHFFSIVVDHEYPYYDALGIDYHRN